MSASPSGQSNGQTPTPNSGPPQYIRRPKAADPLRPRKRPIQRPPPNGAINRSNGPKPKGPRPGAIRPHGLYPVNGSNIHGSAPKTGPADPFGWSTTPEPGTYTDYPLVTTKRELREGLRYHIARFSSKKDIDPSNQDEFTRPVVLHRRDPKQDKLGKIDPANDEPMDSKEREKLEILKAEKEKQRAIDLAQIAPTGNSNVAAKKQQTFKNEKTTQVHRLDKTEAEKKASDLRYEEALPWHLEDADNKNTWVGNYEAALSDTNAMFIVQDGVFKMIPIEKWYKFTAKGQFKTFTSEEAEERMSKKVKESRWVMKDKEQKKTEQENIDAYRALRPGLYTVKSESTTFKNSSKRETEDMDDLDFDGDDLFQDDDEQVTVEKENDEDTKEAQERIKKDQLAANFFDQNVEAEVDLEAELSDHEKKRRKLLGKSVKKALKKRERNLIYDSDGSDGNPYSEESEDDTSDEEKQAEIDRKKDEEAKNKAKEDPKALSGTSSKGTNTPSGRPKHTDALKKPNLKRPGGDVSESSGNESSRKKQKTKKNSATGSSTPIPGSRPGSRPMSPAPMPGQSPLKSSIVKLNVNPSKLSDIQSAPPNPSPVHATSDGEATGGEMSDGGTMKKKIKLRLGPSPTASRQGSPTPGRAGSEGAGGSRATSPSAPAQSSYGPIKPEEVAAALPESGITIGGLMKFFSGRVGEGPNQTAKSEFIRLVKENSKYGSDKFLRPK